MSDERETKNVGNMKPSWKVNFYDEFFLVNVVTDLGVKIRQHMQLHRLQLATHQQIRSMQKAALRVSQSKISKQENQAGGYRESWCGELYKFHRLTSFSIIPFLTRVNMAQVTL